MRINYLFLICLMALSLSATAQSRDEKLVAESVERLRKAMIDPDRTTLDKLASVKLSYGHSSGKIEDKAGFIEALVSGQSDFINIFGLIAFNRN
ncbi:MAG: nuclear transport factor 2 family protein, partial [Chitinophagaceae bacterium]